MRLFLVHDSQWFHDRLCPVLESSYRNHSFAPLAELAPELTPRIAEVSKRYHLTADEQPLVLGCATAAFDRRLWRHFAGELLSYTAADAPAFPTAPELLSHFLSGDLVQRLHRGSRDVDFGGIPFRSGNAGLHTQPDIVELAAALAAVEPNEWSAERLAETPPDERGEELAFARQCFDQLRTLLESARDRGQIIVCEEI
jgi:hypothetical protein